jgi:hypothetical protein
MRSPAPSGTDRRRADGDARRSRHARLFHRRRGYPDGETNSPSLPFFVGRISGAVRFADGEGASTPFSDPVDDSLPIMNA